MKINNKKAAKLRKDFPILSKKVHEKRLIYVDNAATTQKPRQVIKAIQEYYTSANANIHRGVYQLSEEATNQFDESHALIARFINASKDEVIFTSGTTMSLNLLSYSLPSIVSGRNEILLTEMEHHANLVPWQQLAKRSGMTLRFIPILKDFTLDYEAAGRMIGKKTAIVSVCHISNALGTVNDVKRLCSLAKKAGSYSIIDAAQSIPHRKVDVKEIGCDFLAFSGHKMLGPTGIGVLFGRKELLEKMQPFLTGGDMIRKVTYKDAEWNTLPTKFEAGTPHIEGAIVLAEAVKYLEKIGMANIEAWEKELFVYAIKKLSAIREVKLYCPPANCASGIISFTLDDIHTHDIASLLDDEAICIRGGHHCAMPLMDKLGIAGTSRISFYLYNTFEDIDSIVEAIKKAKKVFKVA